jgi:hypothetical protein
MTGRRLALYTFGMFQGSADDDANQGFHDRNDAAFAAAETAEGYIARCGYEDEPGPASWGPQVYPRFYVERGDGWSPSTISLWTDLESAMAFSYSGQHAEALKHGRLWMVKPEWPPYVLWWVDAAHRPDWAEAVARLEHLADHRPGPHAFDFKSPFGSDGLEATLDRPRIKALAALNASRRPQ